MSAVLEAEAMLSHHTHEGHRAAILNGSAAMTTVTIPTPSRIVLTGFMGAGKTTVGRMLASELGWGFVDVDDEIVRKAGMTVAEVFAKYGEFVFRRMETSAIAHALGAQQTVVALGGGAVEVLANRLLLEQTPRTAVVLLEAALPVLLARCGMQPGAAVRPNLTVAEERFRYRAPLYRRVSRFRVETGELTPAETVRTLRGRLGMHDENAG